MLFIEKKAIFNSSSFAAKFLSDAIWLLFFIHFIFFYSYILVILLIILLCWSSIKIFKSFNLEFLSHCLCLCFSFLICFSCMWCWFGFFFILCFYSSTQKYPAKMRALRKGRKGKMEEETHWWLHCTFERSSGQFQFKYHGLCY